MRSATLSLAACLVTTLCGVSAEAGIKTFNATLGSWHTAGNWTPNGVPTHDDRAVIPTGKICEVDGTLNATADTVEIHTGLSGDGILRVKAGRTLTLENDDYNVTSFTPSPDHSKIDGQLILEETSGSGSTLSFTTRWHQLNGAGQLYAEQRPCEIKIAGNLTLVNALATDGILGSMTITGLTGSSFNGTFKNQGLVTAQGSFDGGSGLVLAATTPLQDVDGARWAANCKSEMVFKRQTLTLLGDFEHTTGPGSFTFDASIKTCGAYKRNPSCGNLYVVEGVTTFSYAEFVGNTSCPDNPGSGGGTCIDPYVVSADNDGFSCA